MSETEATIGTKAHPIFGFDPTTGNLQAIVARILANPRSEADGVGLVVTPNIYHIDLLRTNRGFADAYQRATMILCDGWPVYYYARFRGHAVSLSTGCDLFPELLDRLALTPAEPVMLVVDSAGTKSVIEDWAAGRGVSSAVFVHVPPHGFLNDEPACEEIVRLAQSCRPRLLVMGVGAPQSEVFVDRFRARLPPCWAICVGQAVKVAFGIVHRAPPFVRRMHLEWLWRLAQEPRRLSPRYLRAAGSFVAAVVEDLARRSPRPRPTGEA